MRRRLLAVVLLALLAAAAYVFLIRDSSVAPRVSAPRAVARIGSGPSAIVVTADGMVVPWLPAPPGSSLPELPLSQPPKSGRLAGSMLEQTRVLGAAPPALERYLKSSYYGESGVDVELTSGIELRFGDASQAARKWKAAAAVLADPSITALDYVDLHAPSRPAIGGSGHPLPPAP